MEDHCLPPPQKYQFSFTKTFVPQANSACAFHQLSHGRFKYETKLPLSRFPFKLCGNLPGIGAVQSPKLRFYLSGFFLKHLSCQCWDQTIGSDFARGPELAGKSARGGGGAGGGLRQRWQGGALAPVTSAGLQQRSARHRHGRHRGVNTLLHPPHQRGGGTSTRSWQVFYPEPFSILVKHLSTLQRTNSTNRERK